MTSLRRRAAPWVAWGLVAILVGVAVAQTLLDPEWPGDYLNFVTFGEVALAGELAYDLDVEEEWLPPGPWASWPPSFAPLAAVLALVDGGLGRIPTLLMFQLGSLAALAVVLGIYARWLYGRRLVVHPSTRTRRGGGGGETGGGPDAALIGLATLPILAGLLVPARLMVSNLEHSQSNLHILAIAVVGFWLLGKGRRLWGGLAVGVATAFKATPLLLLPYLAWRGRWRDLAASLGGCALAWGVLPLVLLGPGRGVEWYGAWIARATRLDPVLDPLRTSLKNQSLSGTLGRLVPGEIAGVDAATAAMAAVTALLLVAAAVAFGRPFRRAPGSTAREARELAVVLAATALFSPVAWKAHFGVLVPLGMAVFSLTPAGRAWVAERLPAGVTEGEGGPRPGPGDRDRRRPEPGAHRRPGALLLYGALAGFFLMVNFTAIDIIGRSPAMVLEHYGIVTWPTLVLMAAALWGLWRERTAQGQR